MIEFRPCRHSLTQSEWCMDCVTELMIGIHGKECLERNRDTLMGQSMQDPNLAIGITIEYIKALKEELEYMKKQTKRALAGWFLFEKLDGVPEGELTPHMLVEWLHEFYRGDVDAEHKRLKKVYKDEEGFPEKD